MSSLARARSARLLSRAQYRKTPLVLGISRTKWYCLPKVMTTSSISSSLMFICFMASNLLRVMLALVAAAASKLNVWGVDGVACAKMTPV